MKIDPRTQLPGDIQADSIRSSKKSGGPSQSQGTPNASGTGPASGEDTVSISSIHGDVQTLKASFADVPEVRTGRVTALQQRVNSGQYAPSSEKIADAVIADQSSRIASA